MTCKDCVHYDACTDWIPPKELLEAIKPEGCNKFKNKADLKEVVRCRDCVNRVPFDEEQFNYKGKVAMFCIYHNRLCKENGYCEAGRRKEA